MARGFPHRTNRFVLKVCVMKRKKERKKELMKERKKIKKKK